MNTTEQNEKIATHKLLLLHILLETRWAIEHRCQTALRENDTHRANDLRIQGRSVDLSYEVAYHAWISSPVEQVYQPSVCERN